MRRQPSQTNDRGVLACAVALASACSAAQPMPDDDDVGGVAMTLTGGSDGDGATDEPDTGMPDPTDGDEAGDGADETTDSGGGSGSDPDDDGPGDDTGPPPAGRLFAEDFDDAPDWQSTSVGSCANGGHGCEDDVPAPWDLMYLDQPSVAEVGPTCEIGPAGAIGGAGKGLRFVDDSRGRANAWKADCQLIEHLGEVYSDLYFRFEIEWNPAMTLADFNAAKIFRAGYYLPGYFDGTTSGSIFGTADSTRGMVFIDIKRESGDEAHLKAIYRCNPGYQTDCRGPDQASLGGWSTHLADGQPHEIIFRMKNNTGTDADGVFQAWWDGAIVLDVDDVQWTTSGDNLGGFNTFSVGGNQDHNWACGGGDFPDNEMCDDESQEWKHNIDNVVVGTTWESVQP